MSYYVEINGVPSCRSKLSLDDYDKGFVYDPPTVCAHATAEDAEKQAKQIRTFYPHANVVIKEGHCPSNAEEEDAFQEHCDSEDEFYRGLEKKNMELKKLYFPAICIAIKHEVTVREMQSAIDAKWWSKVGFIEAQVNAYDYALRRVIVAIADQHGLNNKQTDLAWVQIRAKELLDESEGEEGMALAKAAQAANVEA